VTELTQLIEAALFASSRPLTLEELSILDGEATLPEVRAALDGLREHYDFDGHGVQVVEVGGGWQILTRANLAETLERARVVQRSPRLTPAMLETLAVIAYRQPVGRAEIEDIRGVQASGVLRSLQERDLIEVVGRSEGLGRPLLYGTTPLFLELLGMVDIAGLPRAEEFTISLRSPEPEKADEDDAAAYVEADA